MPADGGRAFASAATRTRLRHAHSPERDRASRRAPCEHRSNRPFRAHGVMRGLPPSCLPRSCHSARFRTPSRREPKPLRRPVLAPIHPAQSISKLGQRLALRPQTEPPDEGAAGCATRRPNMELRSPGHEECRVRIDPLRIDGVSAVEKAHDLRIEFKVDEVGAVTRATRTERQLRRLQNGHFRTSIRRPGKTRWWHMPDYLRGAGSGAQRQASLPRLVMPRRMKIAATARIGTMNSATVAPNGRLPPRMPV